MSDEMQHDDALEQRLRAHYVSEFGQPPASAAIWKLIHGELPSLSRDEADSMPTVQPRPTPTRPATTFPSSIRHTHALRLRSLLSIVAAALLVAVFAVVLLLHPFGRSTAGTSTAKDTPLPAGFTVHVLAPDELWSATSLSDVQMFSVDDGWAVGSSDTSHGEWNGVILHYAHGKWTPSPDVFPFVNLSSISMLSPTEGWAAGSTTSSDNPIPVAAFVHYSNGHWTSVQTPPGLGQILSLSMLTPRDGWAIQSEYVQATNSAHYSLLHYDGTTWSIADTGGMSLESLAMLSPSEGWAAGQDGAIAHFHNGTWTRWHTTAPGDVTYMTMVSPTDGWMSGWAPGTSADPRWQKPHHEFMLHYNGHDWQPVTLPALPNLLNVYPSATRYHADAYSSISSMSMVSPTEGWAAGNLNGGAATVLYHYTGDGWHVYPFGVNAYLYKIRMVSASEGWAIGEQTLFDNTGNVNGADGVVLHYTQGTWTIYKP